jgi:hypothetical protein
MTALLDRPSLFDAVDPAIARRALATSAVARRHRRGAEQVAAVGGGGTLEAVVSGVWEALSAHRAAQCLVCGGQMVPRCDAAGRPRGGRCADCGATLG